jgi:hypothetical protein
MKVSAIQMTKERFFAQAIDWLPASDCDRRQRANAKVEDANNRQNQRVVTNAELVDLALANPVCQC